MSEQLTPQPDEIKEQAGAPEEEKLNKLKAFRKTWRYSSQTAGRLGEAVTLLNERQANNQPIEQSHIDFIHDLWSRIEPAQVEAKAALDELQTTLSPEEFRAIRKAFRMEAQTIGRLGEAVQLLAEQSQAGTRPTQEQLAFVQSLLERIGIWRTEIRTSLTSISPQLGMSPSATPADPNPSVPAAGAPPPPPGPGRSETTSRSEQEAQPSEYVYLDENFIIADDSEALYPFNNRTVLKGMLGKPNFQYLVHPALPDSAGTYALLAFDENVKQWRFVTIDPNNGQTLFVDDPTLALRRNRSQLLVGREQLKYYVPQLKHRRAVRMVVHNYGVAYEKDISEGKPRDPSEASLVAYMGTNPVEISIGGAARAKMVTNIRDGRGQLIEVRGKSEISLDHVDKITRKDGTVLYERQESLEAPVIPVPSGPVVAPAAPSTATGPEATPAAPPAPESPADRIAQEQEAQRLEWESDEPRRSNQISIYVASDLRPLTDVNSLRVNQYVVRTSRGEEPQHYILKRATGTGSSWDAQPLVPQPEGGIKVAEQLVRIQRREFRSDFRVLPGETQTFTQQVAERIYPANRFRPIPESLTLKPGMIVRWTGENPQILRLVKPTAEAASVWEAVSLEKTGFWHHGGLFVQGVPQFEIFDTGDLPETPADTGRDSGPDKDGPDNSQSDDEEDETPEAPTGPQIPAEERARYNVQRGDAEAWRVINQISPRKPDQRKTPTREQYEQTQEQYEQISKIDPTTIDLNDFRRIRRETALQERDIILYHPWINLAYRPDLKGFTPEELTYYCLSKPRGSNWQVATYDQLSRRWTNPNNPAIRQELAAEDLLRYGFVWRESGDWPQAVPPADNPDSPAEDLPDQPAETPQPIDFESLPPAPPEEQINDMVSSYFEFRSSLGLNDPRAPTAYAILNHAYKQGWSLKALPALLEELGRHPEYTDRPERLNQVFIIADTLRQLEPTTDETELLQAALEFGSNKLVLELAMTRKDGMDHAVTVGWDSQRARQLAEGRQPTRYDEVQYKLQNKADRLLRISRARALAQALNLQPLAVRPEQDPLPHNIDPIRAALPHRPDVLTAELVDQLVARHQASIDQLSEQNGKAYSQLEAAAFATLLEYGLTLDDAARLELPNANTSEEMAHELTELFKLADAIDRVNQETKLARYVNSEGTIENLLTRPERYSKALLETSLTWQHSPQLVKQLATTGQPEVQARAQAILDALTANENAALERIIPTGDEDVDKEVSPDQEEENQYLTGNQLPVNIEV